MHVFCCMPFQSTYIRQRLLTKLCLLLNKHYMPTCMCLGCKMQRKYLPFSPAIHVNLSQVLMFLCWILEVLITLGFKKKCLSGICKILTSLEFKKNAVLKTVKRLNINFNIIFDTYAIIMNKWIFKRKNYQIQVFNF